MGKFSLAQSQAVVHQVMQRLAKGSVPLFLSNGLNYYRLATHNPIHVSGFKFVYLVWVLMGLAHSLPILF